MYAANLALRFLLEIAALIIMGMWGRRQAEGVPGVVLMIALPLSAAVLWGIFTVKDDPSRSGNAPVPVRGWVRLLLELGFFGFAVWALTTINTNLGLGFGVIVLVHYLFSVNRIKWLLTR